MLKAAFFNAYARGKKITANHIKGYKEVLEENDLLYDFFGVSDTMVSPLPEKILNNLIAEALPSELDDGSYERTEYDGINISKYKLFCFGNSKKEVINTYELGASTKTIYRALANMEAYLGLGNGAEFDNLMERLNNTCIYLDSKNGSSMYIAEGRFTDTSYIEKELKRICSAMRVDYSTTGLGKYEAGRSTYMGWGSGGMIALGLMLSAASKLNASMKEAMFKEASVYASFNNIIYYFNNTYCANSPEWQAYVAVHPQEKISLS